jgi:release factor glutamine methyltransferase
MTIRQTVEEIHRQLTGKYPETEIESFVRIIFRQFLDMNPVQTHLLRDEELSSCIEIQIRETVDELKKFRPLQYILGTTDFYGLLFDLTPDVLIPRTETEELVNWIVHEYDRNTVLSIVDIGTGSGCIAVALAAIFSNASVWALDISEAALAVAQKNAERNDVTVNFLLKDVLNDGMMGFESGMFDVIVSNPPYVTPSEQQQMLPNVLEFEPHCALFTPDNDPMIFYKRIAEFGLKCLKNGGRIFFEINEAFPTETVDILKQYGYSDIIPRKDICGKWRMVSAKK